MTSKHCRRCGRELVERRERDGFDRYTGEPTYNIYMVCPAYRWYRSTHTQEQVGWHWRTGGTTP